MIDLPATLVRVGPLAIGWHGVLTALALLVALRMGSAAAGRTGLSPKYVSSIATWSVVGGIIGARTFFVIDHLAEFTRNPPAALAIWDGGIAVYGAFTGGVLFGVIAARRNGARLWAVLDAVTPALLVGQAIGRIGCLVNGDASGSPTNLPWAVTYRSPDALLPPDLFNVPTHPYPLYEVAAVGALAALLAIFRGRLPEGRTFLVAVIGYAISRFVLTAFRQEAMVLADLQQAQVVAIVTALAAGALLLNDIVTRGRVRLRGT